MKSDEIRMIYFNQCFSPEGFTLPLGKNEFRFFGEAAHSPMVIDGEVHDLMPVVTRGTSGQDPILQRMEWGFIPDNLQNETEVARFRSRRVENGKMVPHVDSLNASAWALFAAGSVFSEAARQRRCLIPSTGFYVWNFKFNKLRTRDRYFSHGKKTPYLITLNDAEPFFIAGIFNSWENRETGGVADSVVMIVTEGNEFMGAVNNKDKRMPVILDRQLAWLWLMEDLPDREIFELAKYQREKTGMYAQSLGRDFYNMPIREEIKQLT